MSMPSFMVGIHRRKAPPPVSRPWKSSFAKQGWDWFLLSVVILPWTRPALKAPRPPIN